MSKINFQVDGVGINAEHYGSFSEEAFIEDILPAIPDRFGDDTKKKAWAKNAFDIMIKKFPQEVAAVKAPAKK